MFKMVFFLTITYILHVKNVIGTRLVFYSIEKKIVLKYKNMIKHFVCVSTTYSDELNNLNIVLKRVYKYVHINLSANNYNDNIYFQQTESLKYYDIVENSWLFPNR